MGERSRVLIADDDDHIRDVVRFALERAGFSVLEARDGAEAIAMAHAERPDLIVLDVGMPERDGTEVCRAIRRESQTPIVFLSARGDEIDRVVGLEIGADDYITKPFSPRELVARVRAVLRRAPSAAPAPSPRAPEPLVRGPLALDVARFEVCWGGRALGFTKTEFELVRTLMRHPGRVYAREELMRGMYDGAAVVSDRTVDSHVRKVRRKFAALGADPIRTVHGVGYTLDVDA